MRLLLTVMRMSSKSAVEHQIRCPDPAVHSAISALGCDVIFHIAEVGRAPIRLSLSLPLLCRFPKRSARLEDTRSIYGIVDPTCVASSICSALDAILPSIAAESKSAKLLFP